MSEEKKERLRVLELYSGIGGMHWALKESKIPFEIVLAVDINTTANKIYQHNFPDSNLDSFGIEKLTLKKLKLLRPTAILMSPPCQPFSRCGKKGDCDDVRTKSFLHILQLLQQMESKPGYILVENVKGFEVSRTRQMLMDTLLACDYGYQEYLLTPLQFGIPNSRLRYYLIAKLKGLPHPLPQANEIFDSLSVSPTPQSQCHEHPHSSKNDTSTSPQQICNTTHTSPHPQTSQHINSIHASSTCNSQQFSRTDHSSSDDARHTVVLCTKCSEISSVNNDSKDTLENKLCSRNPDHLDKSDGNHCVRCGVGVSNEMDTNTHDISPPVISGASAELSGLMDAGRNMRFCEELDALIDENSRPLSDYMEGWEDGKLHEDLLVSDKDLRQFVVMDVVLPQLKKSTCFTKRYGHYVEGAGSLVQMSSSVQDTRAASRFKSKAVQLKNKHDWGEEEFSILRKLKLRYFSPREVSNLLCFPPDFDFPPDVSDIQKYRCLGNSLNVHVVAKLIRRLAEDDFREKLL